MASTVDYLVCYDIREPKRLLRVHKCVLNYAVPLQYSVYFARLTRSDLELLMDDLAAEIDERVDDVRIYPVATPEKAVHFGDMPLLLKAGPVRL